MKRSRRPIHYKLRAGHPHIIQQPRPWRSAWPVAIIVLIGVVVVMRIASAPSQGRLMTATELPKLTKHRSLKQPVSPPGSVQSPYFNLPLPAGYKVQAASSTVPGLEFTQNLIKPSLTGSLVVAIAVKSLPAGGLQDEPAYKLRTEQPSRYRVSKEVVNGQSVTIANDAQSAAVVAFWPHGGHLATIGVSAALSNPSADDNADELAALKPLLAAWQWRN